MAKTSKKRVEDQPNHGGKRRGAGRPPKEGGPTVPRTYRILEDTDERIKALVGENDQLKSEADVVDAAVKAFVP